MRGKARKLSPFLLKGFKVISKIAYRKVVAKLDHFRKQHLEDRAEHPNALPIAWGGPLGGMIERTVRECGGRVYKGLADEVLRYLANKGLLVPYAGDYTFPEEF